jgi:uncharacterized protein YqgV (UPF0045/DUF77 family)
MEPRRSRRNEGEVTIMQITVEISYYPLSDQYKKPINDLLERLTKSPEVAVNTGIMSSVLAGEYDVVMNMLTREIKPFLEKYPSIFILKIGNACKT